METYVPFTASFFPSVLAEIVGFRNLIVEFVVHYLAYFVENTRVSGNMISDNTRIIIYTGHREIGLVLAGHYFLKTYLVLAVKSE